ncbi:MAG: hypothetical protein ACREM6_02835 [Vulcanimicrobiaceae bacterium]
MNRAALGAALFALALELLSSGAVDATPQRIAVEKILDSANVHVRITYEEADVPFGLTTASKVFAFPAQPEQTARNAHIAIDIDAKSVADELLHAPDGAALPLSAVEGATLHAPAPGDPAAPVVVFNLPAGELIYRLVASSNRYVAQTVASNGQRPYGNPADAAYTVTRRNSAGELAVEVSQVGSTEQSLADPVRDHALIADRGRIRYDGVVFPDLAQRIVDGPFLVDLDGNGDSEVIVDGYSGGAHCCTSSAIFRRDRSSGRYVVSVHDWRNSKSVPRLVPDPHGRGFLFVSGDDAFAYGISYYAASSEPVAIWRYRDGELQDVTRQYPTIVRHHAHLLLTRANAPDLRADRAELQPILLAYLADEYSLGTPADGWTVVRARYGFADRAHYFATVRAFLRQSGYIK